MADADYTNSSGPASYASGFGRMPFVLEAEVDFSANNHDSNDVLNVLAIKAGFYVLSVIMKVVTPEGATLTVDIGDGDDPDGYIDGANGNATAGTEVVSDLALTNGTPNTVTGYTAGKYYAADDTIDLIPKNNADAAVVRVRALCFDLSESGDTPTA